VLGLAGWAIEIAPDEPSRILRSSQEVVTDPLTPTDESNSEATPAIASVGGPDRQDEPHRAQGRSSGDAAGNRDAAAGVLARSPEAISEKQRELLVAEAALQERRARTALAEMRSRALGIEDAPVETRGQAASRVQVRVGDHGEFERVVFEWPETIDHDVVHRGEQVLVTFGRPGRIDFSGVWDRFGRRVLEAHAEGGELTERVVLRVSPHARIRSFSLEDDRVIVVDVLGAGQPRSRAPPAPDPEPEAIQELRGALQRRDALLEQRDAVIANLLARVENLERNLVMSGDDLDRVAAGGAGATPSVGGGSLPPPGPRPGAAPEPAPGAPASEPSAGPGEPAGPEQQTVTASQGQGSAGTNVGAQPGEFEVVEEEIDRALERTLVQTGVLLLPPGQAEAEPFFSYTRREADAPALALIDGAPAGAEIEVRRNEFVSGQTLRFGMPYDSQVEFEMPNRLVEQSTVTKVDFGERHETDHVGYGMGDLSIGVAKTLVRENGNWWPDLIGRVTWDTATGKTSSNDVALGGGFNELRGSLSAVKRQDPLAFIGGLSYEKTFENNNVEPGDALGFTIGTVLAASPGTSLRLALDQRFIDASKVDGESINGSDSVVGVATLGASVVLGRGILLDVAADIGLTDDAPDYAARASVPIRFNLPTF
jgi:hypothetical protein